MGARSALAAMALVLVVGAVPAAAMELRVGPAARVAAGETVADDVYAAGPWVVVGGRVRGDLIAAGGHVDHAGQVDGDLVAAAGTVTASGRVGAAIRLVGGNVILRGAVGGDVVAAAGTLLLVETAEVARDMAVVGGTITLMGTVGRHARLAAERVEIGGTIVGDLSVTAAEIALAPTALVRGNVLYRSNRPIVMAPGARVLGRVEQLTYPPRPAPPQGTLRALRIGLGIADFVWMLVVALVLVALAPSVVQATADVLRARPWASLGWGALLLVATPVAVVVLFVMVLGIPVGMLLVVAQVLGLFVSHAAAGLAFGQAVAPRLGSRYAAVALGVAVVAVLTSLPFVGWLLRLVVVALGFGAVVLTLWQRRAPAPPGSPAPLPPVPKAVA
ncbi:MAG: polymer-forming cytoskeletal protein [Armatimonadota bacterium]|nr:polymer-forming cytoskeletal protein [Armatimonadota bacterium]MDR7454591.1 polymer-forming cytoskeletal protein [Armatimonadota bacterium]MDR7456030.1 polymer-forming cytoskeletal protein [Armatimonadota bacterium]MDR7495933.1 polymer-forming cytoskeletal protein [Armatimonadota bacterium]MDR7511305.1 polymer-forming cytoskeletal protein [Armatimonadota bacterium]